MDRFKKKNYVVKWIPLIGILGFCCLFVYSSTLYPGGSQVDLNSVGYDWANNYWCNLMNTTAMNGELNPSRPWAISGMFSLCFGLLVFFWQFAEKTITNVKWNYAVKSSAFLSMASASFMFTRFHDIQTIISSLFGLIVVFSIIIELLKSDLFWFKITAIFIIILLALNNYIYYSKQLIELLPILQKLSFATVLIWVSILNFNLKKIRSQ